ncbi:unnamed protein product [Miscanthus lutarioriparius]|uniref:Cytochrome b561 domain-containing protein n=1 Tax=Miscanthus lutarioriparius TaxID=422564 RepID=A0A811PNZ6_9POAL|nr:unnamed protein product [Miscanthus lutarioriparius]
MVLGPIVLAGEAILSYRSLPLARDARKKVHLALHAAGLAAGVLGVYAVFKFHVESGIPNLYSLHSWVGIAAITLYGLQWTAGFLTYFFPGASPATSRRTLPWHAVFGLLIFVLAVCTAQLGFLQKLTFMQGQPLRLPKVRCRGAARQLHRRHRAPLRRRRRACHRQHRRDQVQHHYVSVKLPS